MTQSPVAPHIPGLTHVRRLGSGGYADVYLYQQHMPSRRVAVKVMKAAALSEADQQRFAAEANAMALLEHPHIVPVYEAGATADGRPYLVMMYYPQASLAERARRERFTVAEVLRIGVQIGSAVETAHRAGLLHRDIKPANILTNQYGTPGLTDFGIASHVSDTADEDAGVSVPWSPVETLYATGPATERTDVYALAATLWHLLVGRSPFEVVDGDNSTSSLMRRIRDVPAPSTGRADIPASFDRLLRAALAKEPQVRPASALALARSLQAVEQELRLTRTEIALAADDATMRAAGALPAPDGTRVKPQLVGVRPATQLRSDLTSPRGVGRPDDPATRARPGVEAAEEGRRPPGRGAWVALGALVVVVGAVVVLQLPGTGQAPGGAATANPAPPPELGRPLPDPGAARVDASRDGDQVTFTWTYEHPLPDDSFLVSVDGADPSVVHDPTHTVTAEARACARIRVLREDGSGYQAEYSPEGCA